MEESWQEKKVIRLIIYFIYLSEMEKKEKKSDLEWLLNGLIEKGWEPFGSHKDNIRRYKYDNRFFDFNHEWDNMVSIRELVSKESWIWQFVCENGMIKIGRVFISWTKNANCDNYWDLFWDKACPKDFYEYRLIESALCDEDKLEEFLLNSIKLD
jgi:hypothetical protein